ncbi:MAG: T9SS type A sorting domain-containing protein, partial [Bacteroidetes bacterium]|nr:T9SS type A sorting domain-containing protein [Bacteroidota bacterium]
VFTNKTIAQNSVENISTNAVYSTIQVAIDSSTNGDTIIAKPGTYVENINFNGKNIVLASQYLFSNDTNHIENTIIDGNQNGSCVIFENEEDSTTMLCGFTISNGSGYYYPNHDTSSSGNVFYDAVLGGGIYCDSANPKLFFLKIVNDSLISSYEYKYGAGIYLNYSNSIIENCDISYNGVNYLGSGAIYCLNSNLKIIETNIIDNLGLSGLFSNSSNVYIENAVISNNSNDSYGGGIQANYSNINIENVRILNNFGFSGGGISCVNSNFNINNTIIQNNTAGTGPGGIAISYSDSFNISNTKIYENSGFYDGGIGAYDANINFRNVEIIGNESWDGISGALIYDCTVDFRNCLIVRNDNQTQNPSGIAFYNSQGFLIKSTIANNNCHVSAGSTFSTSDIVILNTIIYGNYLIDNSNSFQFDLDGPANIAYSNIGNLTPPNNIFSQGNIQTNPFFVNPIPTVPYSGYQNLSYHLLGNSPCIDTGTDFYVYNGDTILDLDPSEYYGSAPDMGYYEYQFQPSTQIDIGVTDLIYPTGMNCGLSSFDSIIVLVRNFGSDTVTSFNINYSISQSPYSLNPVNETILPGANKEILLSNNFNFSTPNEYELCASTGLLGDTINSNDSLTTIIFSGTEIDNFPYFTDFETNNGFWKKSSQSASWEWGVPNGSYINSAPSGTNIWATNLSNDIFMELSYIESPCFDFSNLTLPVIMFDFILDIDVEDGTALQSSIDDGASWQYVGAMGDTGNWYNDTCSSLDIFGTNTGSWFYYSSQIQWRNASHTLQNLAGEANVKFRFVISCQPYYPGDEGFAFDNFSIYETAIITNTERIYQKPFALYQNTPNPFSETTKICFYVPKKTDVEISVYNVLGEKIETFVSKSFATGNHSIKFNSKKYNSGTYFYKMTCPDFVDTKNMIILE